MACDVGPTNRFILALLRPLDQSRFAGVKLGGIFRNMHAFPVSSHGLFLVDATADPSILVPILHRSSRNFIVLYLPILPLLFEMFFVFLIHSR